MRGAALLFVAVAAGLKPLPPASSTRRGALLAASSLVFNAQASFAEDEDAPLYDVAKDAAERIRTEGALKSTGKEVPLPLIGAIVLGFGAAGASFALGIKSDTPVPTGLGTGDAEAYEASKWINDVDLPWMPDAASEAVDAEDSGSAE